MSRPLQLKAIGCSRSEMALVPSPNRSISNTPTGPFQIIVLADSGSLPNLCTVAGPMSRIIASSATCAAQRPSACALARHSRATVIACGRKKGIGNAPYIRPLVTHLIVYPVSHRQLIREIEEVGLRRPRLSGDIIKRRADRPAVSHANERSIPALYRSVNRRDAQQCTEHPIENTRGTAALYMA